MDNTGMATLDDEIENTYRLLTAEDVSTGVRTQAETALERNGINTEDLEHDFVSHQAIHTYLTNHWGVERPSESTGDRVEKTEDIVQRLGSRLVAVRVVCEDCGIHADVRSLLDDGGCDCDTEA